MPVLQEKYDSGRGIYYRLNEWQDTRSTLVFIHGLSGSSSVWRPFEKHFANRFNTLAVDLRGHGKSAKYSHFADYRIDTVAQDVVYLLRTLGVGEYILVGHSFGTLVTIAIAHTMPAKPSAVILIAPVYRIHTLLSVKIITSILSTLVRVSDFFPLKKVAGHHIDYEFYRTTGDWNVRRIWADVRNTSIRAYLYVLGYVLSDTDDNQWVSLPCERALFIHGEKDSMVPLRLIQELSSKLPTSTLAVLKNRNHVVPMGYPEEVLNRIDTFLKTIPASALASTP